MLKVEIPEIMRRLSLDVTTRPRRDGVREKLAPASPALIRLDVLALMPGQSPAVIQERSGGRLVIDSIDVWAALRSWGENLAADMGKPWTGYWVLEDYFVELCGMPWIVEFYLEVSEIRRIVGRADGEDPPPRRAGRCFARWFIGCVDELPDVEVCGEALYFPATGSGHSLILCRRCGYRYARRDLMRLDETGM